MNDLMKNKIHDMFNFTCGAIIFQIMTCSADRVIYSK